MTSTLTRLALITFLTFAALGGLLVARPQTRGSSTAPAFVRVTPQDVKWVTDTDGSGVQRAVLEGDPAKPGLYVIRVKFPRGMMSTNHYHREDRHVVVIQGTWYSGTGDEFAPEKTLAMKPGSYMKHPGGASHFDGAREEEVIVQIIGIGPTETVRLRPQQGNYVNTMKK
jgi:quercetin dioxygenase-like cupin family protein